MAEHLSAFRKNFADNKLQVVCDCGWSSDCDDYDEGHRLFDAHKALRPLPAPLVEQDTTVADMSLARFKRAEHPQGIDPITALDAAKAWCLAQDDDSRPQHIIIIVGRTDDKGASQTNFFQAGSYGTHAQFGLAHAGITTMRREAK